MEQRAISSDLIRGHIDNIILHTLLNGDKFAQQISDAIEEKSNGDYKINQATLYSSLKRLENLKHVNSYWYDSTSGRRKYFKLTDLGRTVIEENLSNWSYSCSIINKLMNCEPKPIYKVQYIEKEIPNPIQQTSPVIENKNENNVSIIDQKVEQKEIKNAVENDSVSNQDINFRSILNGLVKATAVQTQEQTQLSSLEKVDEIAENLTEKMKFNDTLDSTDYNAHKANNNGKIDFGDLTLQAAKEGYKIKISSKDSAVLVGSLFVNKLKACSSVLLLFLMVFELLIINVKYGALLNMSALSTCLASAFILLFPTICVAKFLKNSKKLTAKRFYGDEILTSAIVAFNLLLITFAANLLCNVDFTDTYTILLSLVIPMLLYLDVFLYFIIKHFISKLKFCKNNTQQKKPC